MSLFKAITRAFVGDPGDPTEIDFVPVSSDKDFTPAIERARQKLGRPFAPEVKVQRVTPPSHHLEHINARSEQARKVTRLSDHRRKS